MALKLQQETPADSDLFKGGSHQNVADRMAEVIKEQDINILGLEGELGSGKSTIIHFLKKKLSPEYTFIDFDAEIYHYGNTKKALIEVIHDGLSESKGANKDNLDKLKNTALGNIVKYDKKVSSRLSWWTVIFILLCLLSVQMVRYLLLDINANVKTPGTISGPVMALEIISALSPGLLLLWLLVRSWLNKKSRGNSEEITTVGDLFKQNSTDSITEKWLINREIGTIELTNALAGFTSSSSVSAEAKFILIIDNLDRISADKVKELWSDMELIAGTTHKQFRIIVPYSARHVAKSLLVEGHTGREFISKRIPVTFTVPPLVTAGWQDTFRVMWRETVNEKADFSCGETMQILERWRTVEYPRTTPRLLKKLVNDVHILLLTVPAEAPEEYVLLALYVIFVRYNESDVAALLRFTENESINLQPAEYEDKLRATQAQLNRIFMNDTQRWSEYLMSIHFQATVELARTELFDIPLTEAVNNRDPVALEKLTALYGFSHAWHRCDQRFSMEDWLETVAKLSDEAIKNVNDEINSSVGILNANYALNERATFRREFSESLLTLKKKNLISPSPFITRQKNHILQELIEAQASPQNEEYITSLLMEANIYSGIFGSSLLEDENMTVSGEFYSTHLLYKDVDYPDLSIDNLNLSPDEREKMLRYELADQASDIFDQGIIRFFGLSNREVSSIIADEKSDLPENISKTYSEIFRNIPQLNIKEFRKIIFHKEWYSKGLLQHIPHQANIKSIFPVEISAHVVAHMVAIDDYNGIESYAKEFIDDEEFDTCLSSYFIYMNSFHAVIKSLKNETAYPYVKNAISIIFRNERLDAINTLAYVSELYPAINALSEDIDILTPLADREKPFSARINADNLENISPQFIADIFATNRLTLVKDRLITLSQSCFSENSALYSAFNSLGQNRKSILSHATKSERFVTTRNVAPMFAEWYRSGDITDASHGRNVRFLWSVLDNTQREEALREMHDILLENDRSIERRVAVIRDFTDVLSFNEPEKSTSRRAIAALFPVSLSDETLRHWLDSQSFKLSNWNKEDAESVCRIVCDNKEQYPSLIESSLYIKKRVQQEV